MNLWCCIIYCHLLFMTFFKQYTKPTVIIMVVLMCNFWLVSLWQNRLMADNLYMQITMEIWNDPLAWMIILCCTVAMSLPLIAFRTIRDLIVYPEFR